MSKVMDILEKSLSADEFAQLKNIVDTIDAIPFKYSKKRRSYSPSDGWFLIDDDSDSDDLMDLAMKCCEILNSQSGLIVDPDDIEIEPQKLQYTVTYDTANQTFAELLAQAFTENGYLSKVKQTGIESCEVSVVFTATSDWEYVNQRSQLSAIYDIVNRRCQGKPFRARKL